MIAPLCANLSLDNFMFVFVIPNPKVQATHQQVKGNFLTDSFMFVLSSYCLFLLMFLFIYLLLYLNSFFFSQIDCSFPSSPSPASHLLLSPPLLFFLPLERARSPMDLNRAHQVEAVLSSSTCLKAKQGCSAWGASSEKPAKLSARDTVTA